MAASFLGIILVAMRIFYKKKHSSVPEMKRARKHLSPTLELDTPDQLSQLMRTPLESDKTSQSVELIPTVLSKPSNSFGTQTVDDEFTVSYFCPVHEILKRQDGRFTPTIEKQCRGVDVMPHMT